MGHSVPGFLKSEARGIVGGISSVRFPRCSLQVEVAFERKTAGGICGVVCGYWGGPSILNIAFPDEEGEDG